jgi:hypothetical protein
VLGNDAEHGLAGANRALYRNREPGMTFPLPPELALDRRPGLPDDLLDLLRRYPRENWPDNPDVAGLAGFWLQRHQMFRELSTLIGTATLRLREGLLTPAEFRPFFRRRIGLLLGQLDEHHNVEDIHYFPAFAVAAPKLKRGFEILDADHHFIHGVIESLGEESEAFVAALSGQVSGKEGEVPRKVDDLAAAIAAFDRNLRRHLDDEEDLVIPLILERARNDPEFG